MSCLLDKRSFLINVFNMLIYVLLGRQEQFGHHLLGQPDSLIFQSDIQFLSTIFCLVDQKLTFGSELEGFIYEIDMVHRVLIRYFNYGGIQWRGIIEW